MIRRMCFPHQFPSPATRGSYRPSAFICMLPPGRNAVCGQRTQKKSPPLASSLPTARGVREEMRLARRSEDAGAGEEEVIGQSMYRAALGTRGPRTERRDAPPSTSGPGPGLGPVPLARLRRSGRGAAATRRSAAARRQGRCRRRRRCPWPVHSLPTPPRPVVT
jgi:hypothetical protein